MNACRICRTKSNLKYAPEQLATKRKKSNANETQEIVGNICLECEQRLLNYHKLDEHKDLEVDSGREETPVIVDDDDLLYNLFFENSNADIEKNASSSDCDTAVIELASSREITPQQNIVAVIDLSDASQSGAETTTTTNAAVNKKRKRHKTYDEKQLIVLAKLNLISSDSEEDEIYPPARARTSAEQQQQQQHDGMPVEQIKTEQTHNEVQCCVCKSVFSDNLELVHHLRSRHRTKEHVTQLRERMRHAQDSALTIRLCFKARFFYYECQMCGHIDDVFRQHKEHVIAKHSHELISLKDPLLKRLQCPVCHVSCGTLYIEVCRHMLQTHSSTQYKFFIEEIISSTDEALKSVATTAQVYRFHSRPNLYFLCRHCKQLNSSINSHRQHLKFKHQIKITHSVYEVQVNNTTANLQQRSLREKKKQQQQELPEQAVKLEQCLEKRKVGRPRKNFVVNVPVKVKKLVKTSVKKGVSNRRAAAEPHTTQRVRIKVKPPIKQIVTQTYNCQYCKCDFEGYILWNLHHLKEHSEQVDCVFNNNNKGRLTSNKHKREKRHKTLSLSVDENSNNVEKKRKMCSIEEEMEKDDVIPYVPNWLQELLEMHQSKQTLKNDDNENLNSFSSGFMKMRPNTAILKQTPNLRCIQLHNRN